MDQPANQPAITPIEQTSQAILPMQQSKKPLRLLIGAGVLALIAIVGVLIYMIQKPSIPTASNVTPTASPSAAQITPTPTPAVATATDEQLNQDLQQADTSLKTIDQAGSQTDTALNDQSANLTY
jgi:hypothetical protein